VYIEGVTEEKSFQGHHPCPLPEFGLELYFLAIEGTGILLQLCGM